MTAAAYSSFINKVCGVRDKQLGENKTNGSTVAHFQVLDEQWPVPAVLAAALSKSFE